MLALTAVRPINHFSGFHTFYPVFASGRSAAPFRNVEDYDNNVRRHRQFVTGIDRAIGRFRQGLASGVVETKLTIRNVIGQLDTQLAAPPEQSPYAGPLQNIPEAIPEAERARLRAELIAVDPRRHLSRLPAAAGTSSRTTICRTPATASASSTCAAATGSTSAASRTAPRCR